MQRAMTWVNAFQRWFCGLSMRRVRTKLPSEKISRRTKKARGPGRPKRGMLERQVRVTDGHRRDSRYLPAFAAMSVSRFVQRLVQGQRGTGTGQSASSKR